MAKLLTAAPLRTLGKYSYSLYVFHQPAALILVSAGISAAIVPHIRGFALPGEVVYAAIAGTLSLLAAVASWHLYEKHFLKLKERFAHEPSESRAEQALSPAPAVPESAARLCEGIYRSSLDPMQIDGDVIVRRLDVPATNRDLR